MTGRILCALGFHRFVVVDPTTVWLLRGKLPPQVCQREHCRVRR